ncbi:MAG: DUF2304 domain-containing protein [bacterium]|nr:DUF2304 domain-containing protein [bacterium]
MRPVQLILIVMLIGILFLYFNRLRSGLVDRVVVALFVVVGITLAAIPDVTMKIAAFVGVGRGADLFMYLALVGIGFFLLVLYSKLRDIESTISELARSVAIDTAHEPGRAADPRPSEPFPKKE